VVTYTHSSLNPEERVSITNWLEGWVVPRTSQDGHWCIYKYTGNHGIERLEIFGVDVIFLPQM